MHAPNYSITNIKPPITNTLSNYGNMLIDSRAKFVKIMMRNGNFWDSPLQYLSKMSPPETLPSSKLKKRLIDYI
eukprot:CAMPEP_0116930332 /NCGR_PEP_ID=MMETSP0467-20121206/27135_1 /TAXON_ID=283647 /ORGANISM="Mesodinium pulex, Strain SPMC105" /LENGTH=73 /DNA_ID=CAMNT_0004610515 /DNA_START=386 /DNA_END=607 /DNA_ORIENTATION=+